MAANCDVCGKGPSFGNNISHSHRRNKRRFDPNIQKKRYWVPSLRRNVTLEEVGNAAVFLCSEMGGGVTGEVIYVDTGYHILAV